MPLLGLLFIIAGVISLAENLARYANSILPIVAGLFFLFGLRALARSSYRRDNRLPRTFEAVVSDSGVNVQWYNVFKIRVECFYSVSREQEPISDLPSAEGF